MRRNHLVRGLAGLVLGLMTADGASAQRGPRRAAPSYPAEPQPPAVRNRGRDVYAVPEGFTGTITASTPNPYGNLGGPSSGGGGGG